MKTQFIAYPLFHACLVGDVELVKQILDYKGNDTAEFINYTFPDGLTSLIIAAMKGHLSIVKLLVEYGCDRRHRDKNGQSALGYARDFGYPDVVEYLQGLE